MKHGNSGRIKTTTILQQLKYLLVSLAVIVGVAFLVLFYIEYNNIMTSRNWLEAEESKILRSEATLLSDEVITVVSDLDFLRAELAHTFNENESLQAVEEQWYLFSKSKKLYDQIRFIDAQGHERIRINYADDVAEIVESDDLQFKGDRYYFSDSMGLEPKQIYMSAFDLNIEHGQVEIPRKPMIRLGMKVIDEDNNCRGIVIINYLGDNLLSKFKKLFDYSEGDLYFINQNGYYLYSGQINKDFAFMFKEYEGNSFLSDYPETWANIENNGGRFISSKGMFTVEKLDFDEKVDKSLNGVELVREDEWYVVSHINKSNQYFYLVNPKFSAIVKKVVLSNSIFLLFLSVLSLVIALLIYQNRESYNQIRYLSEYDGMTGILNRRAGLNSLKELLRTFDEREGSMYLCYIDVDGLKQVNDKLGHHVGDELIMEIINIIKGVIRESDLFIRLGGDEFLVVLHHMDKDVHQTIWDRIEMDINYVNESENRPYIISMSRGIVEVSNANRSDLSLLMKKADEAMYTEKEMNRKVIIR